MKKVKKQALAYVLICALLVSNLFWLDVDNVYADIYSGTAGDNIYWNIDTESGLMSVTGSGDMTSYDQWQWTPYSVSYRNYVTKATVQKGITSIGDNAFCCFEKLEEVTIPSTAISMGYYAFNNCFVIESISAPSIRFIDNHAFYQCYALKNIELGENLSRINAYAFGRCSSLAYIYLPKSLTTVEKYVFSGCDSLTDVYYGGSEEEWKEISIDYGNDDLLNANIHYNSVASDIPEPTTDVDTEIPTENSGITDYSYQWSIENTKLEIAPQYFTTMYGKYQGKKLYNDLNSDPNKEKFGLNGLCYGFALSSAVLEMGDITVNDLFYEDSLFDIKDLYETAKSNFIIHQPIDLIIFSHLYQVSYDASRQTKKNHNIEKLIEELSEGNNKILVYVEDMAHAVIARDVRQISENSWIIDVYDSNLPGDLNQIYIVKQDDTYGYSFTSRSHEITGNTFYGTTDLTYMYVSDNYLKKLMRGETIDKIDNTVQFLLTTKDKFANCNKELYEICAQTDGDNETNTENSGMYWIDGDNEDIEISNVGDISLTGISSNYEILLEEKSDVLFHTNEDEIQSVSIGGNTDANIVIEKEINGENVSFVISGKTNKNSVIISEDEGIELKNFETGTVLEVLSDGYTIAEQEVCTPNIEVVVDGNKIKIDTTEETEQVTQSSETTTVSTQETTAPKVDNISDAPTERHTDSVNTPTTEQENSRNITTTRQTGNMKTPAKTKLTKLKKAKKSLKVSWKKAKNVSGYQIQYSTSKKFKKARKITIKKAKTTSKTIKKLKANTRYYVRIRTYVTVDGRKYYSNWSKKKSQKTK